MEFARQGAKVAVAARRLDRLHHLTQEIENGNGQALAIACDVTKDAEVITAVQETVRRFGRLDVVVANAGFSVPGTLEDLTLDAIRRQFDTNLFGALSTARASLAELKKTKGRLALMGSVMSYVSIPGHGPYSGSKYALRAFAEALTHELRPSGVSVTLICPGFVESEIRLKNERGEPVSDPVPSWLVMPRVKAARQMVRAIIRRRREILITAHGRILVFLVRHVPWFIHGLLRMGLARVPDPKP